MSHIKVASDWLILGTRNPYMQIQAPNFLRSPFGAKRVIIIIIFVNQSKSYLFFVRSAKKNFFGVPQNFSIQFMCAMRWEMVENPCSRVFVNQWLRPDGSQDREKEIPTLPFCSASRESEAESWL